MVTEISLCEVCGNRHLKSVLNLGKHPLCDDLVPVGQSRVCQEYPIEILFCSQCKTAHQRYQVPKQSLFPKSYHYRARFTKDVLNGMAHLVEETERRLGSLKDKSVLDIGCNDGSLLDFFKKKKAKTVGIEPTDAYKDGVNQGHALFNAFFCLETAREIHKIHGTFDVITFTNVFAHIENLPEVIESLKILMHSSTLIVIENHYLGSVLALNQFDTFYHEHPRTYSLTSFQWIAKSLGTELKSVEFTSRYGGNIRIMMSATGSSEANLKEVLENEERFQIQFEELNNWIDQWKKGMQQQLDSLIKKEGKLAAKAFPGRAAILIKTLGLDSNHIACVYEKPGSMKIGHYLPGTRIPIESDEQLFLRKENIRVILNLAWHIPSEIENYLRQNNLSSKIVHIIDK